MTAATASPADDLDAPLARLRNYAQLFTILFVQFFTGPPRRHVARAEYTKASAFMRGLEALARRVLLMRAALIIPTLPPPRPAKPAAAPRSATPRPIAATGDRPPAFRAFRRPPLTARPTSAARASASPKPRPSLADLRPLSRRFDALMHVLENPDPAAHRLARRVRLLYTPEAAPQIIEAPRLHPEHARYLERDLDIWREDANEALRAARSRLTWPTPDSS